MLKKLRNFFVFIKPGFNRKMAIILMVASLLAGAATYAVLMMDGQSKTIYWFLVVDLVLLSLLGAVIARRIFGVWSARRKGVAGSRLQGQFVAVLCFLAVAPAILMAVFSGLSFYFGLQSWFSTKVGTAIEESLVVAEAYLHEHHQTLRADALLVANNVNRESAYRFNQKENLDALLNKETMARNLSEAVIMDGKGEMLARSRLSFIIGLDVRPEEIERARQGEVVLMVGANEDRVRALLRLDGFVDTFLLVGRLVDTRVLRHMQLSKEAVFSYTELEGRRFSLQIATTLIFVVVSLLLLLAAIWVGLIFAGRLATPIARLIEAAEKVGAGDLSARIKGPFSDDEFGKLSQIFNNMTKQLEKQRHDLDERHALLLFAQKQAAWSDIARRMAHEIKNPLTPIQLSAERLKRNYLKQIKDNPETFEVCTDTIIRQVRNIGHLVDEFSSFARMPAARMNREELTDLCRQAVFLQKEAHPDIDFACHFSSKEMVMSCDAGQFLQVLTNLLQNAIDSVKENEGDRKISLSMTATAKKTGTTLMVEDNGKGFKEEIRAQLTEPYVTTKDKGIGLGLSIVKKIVEDHQGTLRLENIEPKGARVTIIFERT